MGYGRPPETRSTAMLGYSSQLLSIPNGCINEQMVVFNLGLRGKPGGLLLACENDTWMFAVARTIDTGGAPPDFATMLALAEVHCPGNHGRATPRAPARGHCHLPQSRGGLAALRPHDETPRGLLVIGDALCSP